MLVNKIKCLLSRTFLLLCIVLDESNVQIIDYLEIYIYNYICMYFEVSPHLCATKGTAYSF